MIFLKPDKESESATVGTTAFIIILVYISLEKSWDFLIEFLTPTS